MTLTRRLTFVGGTAAFAVAAVVACSAVVASDELLNPKQQDPAAKFRTISQVLSNEVPLVIAHRGASGYLPEHTTESAAFAHALGADYIEQDVVLSKDGVAVVLHDVTLSATTNVQDVFPDRAVDGKYSVFRFDLAELRQLSVKERYTSKHGGRFPAGSGEFRIGTFEEHLQLITGLNTSRKRQAGIYVEIKKPALHREHGLDSSKEVVRLLAKYGYDSAEDRAFIQCFEAAEILRLRTELKCRLPLIQLRSGAVSAAELAEISRVADGVGVRISAVLQSKSNEQPTVTDLVATAHQHSLLVHVWTLRTDQLPAYAENTDALLDLLVKKGRVDGVFTDQPDAVLRWRGAMQQVGGIRGPFHLLHGNGKTTE